MIFRLGLLPQLIHSRNGQQSGLSVDKMMEQWTDI